MPRRRGRPRRDRRDQLVVDVAQALRVLFPHLGPQQTRDLALAVLEGEPSYSWEPDGFLHISLRLPTSTIKGRSDALQRRGPRPRAILVRALVAWCGGKDTFLQGAGTRGI
jgi:hypothetical protein